MEAYTSYEGRDRKWGRRGNRHPKPGTWFKGSGYYYYLIDEGWMVTDAVGPYPTETAAQTAAREALAELTHPDGARME